MQASPEKNPRRGAGLKRRRKGLTEPIVELQRPALLDPAASMSWIEAIDKFLVWSRSEGLSQRTIELYKENLRYTARIFTKPEISVGPAEVTEEHLRQFIVDMLNEGKEIRTVNIRLSVWRKFFTWLVNHEKIRDDDPAAGIKKLRETRKVVNSLNEKEVLRLLSVFDHTKFTEFRDYVITVLMLDTGMRSGEVTYLLIDDINLRGHSILVRAGGTSGTTKDGEHRTVYLTSRTVSLLEKWFHLRGDVGHRFCFIRHDGLPMDRNTYRNNLKHVYGPRAKLNLTPHMLRHTFARMFITGGGDPFSLQEILGHSTLDMVKYYVRLWGSDLQRIHRRFSPVERLSL